MINIFISDYSLKWEICTLADSSIMYRCIPCGRRYKLKSSLGNHQRYECGKEAQFRCSFCPYKSYQKGSLIRHVVGKH